MEKEIRSFSELPQIRKSEEDGTYIEGYAVVFDSRSVDFGGFQEVIDRSAITDETIQRSDVLALLDHDIRRGVLARSNKGKGNLTLRIDDHGLWYSYKCPDTEIGNEVRSNIENGIITASSFAFTCLDDKWVRSLDGVLERHITSIDKLYDVSSVYSPAYEATSASTRSKDTILEVMAKLDKISNDLKNIA